MPVFLSEISINIEAPTIPSPLKRERGRNVPVFLSEIRINIEALAIPSPLWGEG